MNIIFFFFVLTFLAHY